MNRVVPFLFAAVLVAGCSTNSKSVDKELKNQEAPSATKSATEKPREYGSSAMSGQAAPAAETEGGASETAASGNAASAAGLSFAAPSDWTQSAPSSNMRAAQYALPAKGGEAPELVLFFFGAGQGGNVESNVSRWIGQMSEPDGSDPHGQAKTSTVEVGNLKITTVQVDGTYAAGGMMGGPSVMKENSRLWGAVVEGPGGPWFWKATGPKDAMEAQAGALEGFLHSMKAGS